MGVEGQVVFPTLESLLGRTPGVLRSLTPVDAAAEEVLNDDHRGARQICCRVM